MNRVSKLAALTAAAVFAVLVGSTAVHAGQITIGEPKSLSLLGLSLIGLGLAFRRLNAPSN